MNREYETDSDNWDPDSETDELPTSANGNFGKADEYLEMNRNGNPRLPPRPSPGILAKNKFADQVEEDENIYANRSEVIRPVRSSVAQTTSDSSSMITKLKEQLQLRMELRQQTTLGAKPKLMDQSPEVIQPVRNKQPLMAPQQPVRPQVSPERPTAAPEVNQSIGLPKMPQLRRYQLPSKMINVSRILPTPGEKPRHLPKPPPNPPYIRNLDLAAELPPATADDSDEYEAMDEQTIKRLQYPAPLSMESGDIPQISASSQPIEEMNEEENYNVPDDSDPEDNDEVYETISEKSGVLKSYVGPIPDRIGLSIPPRPIPPRPLATNCLPRPQKYVSAPSIPSRSPRPLPPPPPPPSVQSNPLDVIRDVASYMTKPWFHNIGRQEAVALIEKPPTNSSTVPPDGYFLLRPPVTAKETQPWTLVLWYKNKTYNIPVRKRPDTRYALGTVKPAELSFESVEELVDFYKKEDLALNTGNGDAQVGKTRLTESPQKEKN